MSRASISVVGNQESIQTTQGLVYAGPRAYLRASVGDGGVDYHETRQVALAGFNDTATGTHGGNILTVRGEGGIPVEDGPGLVVPYAAVTYNHLSQGGCTERSSNGAGLRFASGPVLFDLTYNALARSSYLQQVGLLKAKVLF